MSMMMLSGRMRLHSLQHLFNEAVQSGNVGVGQWMNTKNPRMFWMSDFLAKKIGVTLTKSQYYPIRYFYDSLASAVNESDYKRIVSSINEAINGEKDYIDERIVLEDAGGRSKWYTLKAIL